MAFLPKAIAAQIGIARCCFRRESRCETAQPGGICSLKAEMLSAAPSTGKRSMPAWVGAHFQSQKEKKQKRQELARDRSAAEELDKLRARLCQKYVNGEVSGAPALRTIHCLLSLAHVPVPPRGTWEIQVPCKAQTLEVLTRVDRVPVAIRFQFHLLVRRRLMPVSLAYHPSLGTHIRGGIHEVSEAWRMGPSGETRHAPSRSPKQPAGTFQSQTALLCVRTLRGTSTFDSRSEGSFSAILHFYVRRMYQQVVCLSSAVATPTFHVPTDIFCSENRRRLQCCYPPQGQRNRAHQRNIEHSSSGGSGTKCSFHTRFVKKHFRPRLIDGGYPPNAYVSFPTPYLWHTRQVLFLDLRLPWLDHGAAAEVSV